MKKMTDEKKEIIVKAPGKKKIKVKGKNLLKKYGKENKRKYCPNCGIPITGKVCEFCGYNISNNLN